MSCACALHQVGDAPRAQASLRLDHAALREHLGARPEILDALPAKASGRPSANAAVVWRYFTTSVYQSGDLPVLATRECLQNAIDAIRAAMRQRQLAQGAGRFEVTWDAANRTLSWDDNGIGMDTATILEKFLVIGESGKRDAADSGEAAGGFGVAKAVILGVSPTFRWHLHSRDNLAVGQGTSADVEVFDAEPRVGTKITVHDIPEDFDQEWDHARSAWIPIEQRLRELLAANDLPDIALVLNGEPVRPMFSRRGGSKVELPGAWGPQTTAQIKAYRRPPGDKGGAYYIRLNGLFQFKLASQRGGLKSDVVVDLNTFIRPGQAGYPLNAARDALQDHARWMFTDLVHEVEKENESTGRSDDEEVFDPDDDDTAAELGSLASDAFADANFQRALAEAAGGIVDFYAERLRYSAREEPTASDAPQGSSRTPDEPTRPTAPAGFRATAEAAGEGVSGPAAAEAIRGFLRDADAASLGTTLTLTPEVEDALEQLSADTADTAAFTTIEHAIERASEAAMSPGGGGLLQVAAVPRVLATLDRAAHQAPKKRNPFGRHAGLRINRKTYDRARAARFRKNYGRWMPYLVAWDGTLRLIAAEARIRRRFKPGFVLDDNLLALTARTERGTSLLYIHPDRFAQVVKVHRERPIAIAAYLHGLACHELTHLDSGRLHANGHDERYIVAREDLGAATGHMLPALAVLVAKVLRLPAPPEERRAGKLAQELEKAQAGLREQKALVATLTREADTLRGQLLAVGGPATTPGTRLRWSNLGEWLEAWRTLSARPPWDRREEQRRAHIAALSDAIVEVAGVRELRALEAVLSGDNATPPRGNRAAHPATRLRDAIERARQARARAVLDQVAGVLKMRPPVGVDAAYIDAFFARNRQALQSAVREVIAP